MEDDLLRLGSERNRLESEVGKNLEHIVDAIPAATQAGLSFDEVARLVGVSRQTLHRWRSVLGKLREARA